MDNIIMSLIVFALTFIARFSLFLVTRKKKNKKKYGLSMEVEYLIHRFKLNKKRLNTIGIASIISLLDALIISITIFVAVTITSNIMLEMLIGLVIVVCSIIVVNEILGRILLKKGYDK